MTANDMRKLSAAFDRGERVVMLTPTEVLTFRTSREANRHPAAKGIHVTLGVARFLGGLYSISSK